jgi:hypothetical protein
LKRVFDIDIETCSKCGGELKIIASIEDPVVIRKILTHLDTKPAVTKAGSDRLHPDRRNGPRVLCGRNEMADSQQGRLIFCRNQGHQKV